MMEDKKDIKFIKPAHQFSFGTTPAGQYQFSLTRELKNPESLNKSIKSWLEQIPKQDELVPEVCEEDFILWGKDQDGARYRINFTEMDMMKFTPDADGNVVKVEYWEKISFHPRHPEPDNKTLISDNASIQVTRAVPFTENPFRKEKEENVDR